MSYGDMAGDNRFEIIAKAKQAILDSTNIETDEDEMKVLDNILFRCWQMGWLDKYDNTKNQIEWIPVKWHEITEEEREREGYPKDWVVHIDCDMPCDGDEILVQTKNGYIRWDVCYEDGEFSLDSGWDWIEDIVAWMPLPEPYREEDEE